MRIPKKLKVKWWEILCNVKDTRLRIFPVGFKKIMDEKEFKEIFDPL